MPPRLEQQLLRPSSAAVGSFLLVFFGYIGVSLLLRVRL
jgi:hypothetical protein